MTKDHHWLREQAHLWREMADLGNSEQRDARLKLARAFDDMAAKLERSDRAD